MEMLSTQLKQTLGNECAYLIPFLTLQKELPNTSLVLVTIVIYRLFVLHMNDLVILCMNFSICTYCSAMRFCRIFLFNFGGKRILLTYNTKMCSFSYERKVIWSWKRLPSMVPLKSGWMSVYGGHVLVVVLIFCMVSGRYFRFL